MNALQIRTGCVLNLCRLVFRYFSLPSINAQSTPRHWSCLKKLPISRSRLMWTTNQQQNWIWPTRTSRRRWSFIQYLGKTILYLSRADIVRHSIRYKLIYILNMHAPTEYTCFSNKISTLTRLPGPIRSLVSLDDLRSENHPISAPREVMRLVNWMMSDHTNDIVRFQLQTMVINRLKIWPQDTLFIEYPADERVTEILREVSDAIDVFSNANI